MIFLKKIVFGLVGLIVLFLLFFFVFNSMQEPLLKGGDFSKINQVFEDNGFSFKKVYETEATINNVDSLKPVFEKLKNDLNNLSFDNETSARVNNYFKELIDYKLSEIDLIESIDFVSSEEEYTCFYLGELVETNIDFNNLVKKAIELNELKNKLNKIKKVNDLNILQEIDVESLKKSEEIFNDSVIKTVYLCNILEDAYETGEDTNE